MEGKVWHLRSDVRRFDSMDSLRVPVMMTAQSAIRATATNRSSGTASPYMS
jgi:hypothetical protein